MSESAKAEQKESFKLLVESVHGPLQDMEPQVVFTIRLEAGPARKFAFVCKANRLSQSEMVEAWATQDMRWHEANEVGNLLR